VFQSMVMFLVKKVNVGGHVGTVCIK
jgi:hypothetical protein